MSEQRFLTWHQLFDYLCQRAGYSDNAELATRYCLKSGKKSRQEFEVIQKNLRNWRTGRHLPLRRNLTLLAELLGVEGDHELHRAWHALYAVARGEATQEDTESNAIEDTEARHVSLFDSAGRVRWLAMSVAVAVGGLFTWKSLTEQIAFERLPMIGYDARVKMVVGETRLIHGDRGDCSGEPPDWYGGYGETARLYRAAWQNHDRATSTQPDIAVFGHTFISERSDALNAFYPYYSAYMAPLFRGPMPGETYSAFCSQQGSLVAGSPQQVVDKLAALHAATGCSLYAGQIDIGAQPFGGQNKSCSKSYAKTERSGNVMQRGGFFQEVAMA